MGAAPSPQTMLAIILGAYEWPRSPEFQSSVAFVNAAERLKEYLLSTDHLGLPQENLLDLFNSSNTWNEMEEQISEFLEERISTLREQSNPARDVLIYFIGHGDFAGSSQDYYLAIRRTGHRSIRASGIPMKSLAETLKENAWSLRRFVILDCCYAANAFTAFQGDPSQGAIRQTHNAFSEGNKRRTQGIPETGTALLCSSDHSSASLLMPDNSSTMFSKAILDTLFTGEPAPWGHLSFRQLKDLVDDRLKEMSLTLEPGSRKPPRPALDSPDQSHGDIADVPFFPNPQALIEYTQQEGMTRLDVEQQVSLEQDIDLPDSSDSSPPPPTPEEQARISLINNIRKTWIDGLLEESLNEGPRMYMQLQEQADGWSGAWYLQDQEPEQYHTTLLKLYDQADGPLLILGESGAGKTTLLLEFAKALLERAESDPTCPIPVFFQLSSWNQQDLPLIDWLSQELEQQRNEWKPADLARTSSRTRAWLVHWSGEPSWNTRDWIEQGKILPLLDGLDEVALNRRASCVLAINVYCQDHRKDRKNPLVVSCSEQVYQVYRDYPNLQEMLQRTVSIQPLTYDTINEYLQSAGGQFKGLQRALKQDRELYDMARQPLMLNIFLLSSPVGIPTGATAEERQRHAFENYLKRRFKQGGWQTKTEKGVRRLLIYLAKKSRKHQGAFFSAEDFQPWWSIQEIPQQFFDAFDERVHVRVWSKARNAAFIGLIVGLLGILCLLGWLTWWLITGVFALIGWLFSLIGRFFSWIASIQDPHPSPDSNLVQFEHWMATHNMSWIGTVLTWVTFLLVLFAGLEALYGMVDSLLKDSNSWLWDPASFVEEAAEHHLLLKVGNRYMFMHRLLLDHFAEV